jgi:hypothetical protein
MRQGATQGQSFPIGIAIDRHPRQGFPYPWRWTIWVTIDAEVQHRFWRQVELFQLGKVQGTVHNIGYLEEFRTRLKAHPVLL